MLGIRPVFVLDGEVPDLKQREVKRRINAVCKGGANEGKIKRSRLNAVVVQCQKLLEALGVGSLRSPGEAESMCARLNAALVVDGCISQDSDCFLYGAKVVYRNFSAACSSKGGAGFAVDSYDMVQIQENLGLNREGLVALALLCGCDYQEICDDGVRGVAGIGIETATHLILGLSKMCGSVLSRLKSWRSDSYYSKLEEEAVAINSGPTCIQCGHRGNLGQHDRVGCKGCDYKEGCKVKCCPSNENSLLNMSIEERKLLMLELRVRAKAVAYSGFPPQSIIDEFLAPEPFPIQMKKSDISWNPPHLSSFMEIAETYLGWSQEYSLAKFLPLLTRWKVMHGRNADVEVLHPNDVKPASIKKKRISKGVHCFEVEWNLIPSVLETRNFSTVEPCLLFEKVYPLMVQEFLNKKCKDNQKPKCGADKRTKIQNKNSKVCSCLGNVKKGHICQFLSSNCGAKNKVQDPNSGVSPAVNSVTELMKNVSIHDLNPCPTDGEQISDLDDDFDPLELSAIINCIVEGDGGLSINNGGMEDKKDLAKASEFKSNNLKISTWELPEESLKSIPINEIDNVVKPLHSGAKCLKKESSRVEIGSYRGEMKILCKQLENVKFKDTGKDELDDDNNPVLHSEPSHMKGQFVEPIFDLGISVLLRSPETSSSSSKSVEVSSP